MVAVVAASFLASTSLANADSHDIPDTAFSGTQINVSGNSTDDYISSVTPSGIAPEIVNKPSSAPSSITTWAPFCADVAAGNVATDCLVQTAEACPEGEILASFYTYTTTDPTLVATGTTRCIGSDEPAPPLTPGEPEQVVLTATGFRSLPIPGSTIEMQPDGFSLRNAHTNIYASSATRTLSTTILGQSVAVRATPYEYRWTYGDGSTRTTTTPGAPVSGEPFESETATSHVYTETGDYPVGLTTVYSGQFSVAGGPWMPVAGLATVPSATVEVSVWRTKKLLVDSNCLENPSGPACASPFDE